MSNRKMMTHWNIHLLAIGVLMVMCACYLETARAADCAGHDAPADPADQLDLTDHAEKIDAMMAEAFAADAPGCVILVTKQGEIVLRKGYGLANIELGVAMQPEMLFRIGSITKTYTAAAILVLVEQGKLSLDDNIGDHLPNVPASWKGATIVKVLSHTAGVPNLFNADYYSLIEERAYDLLNLEVPIEDFLKLVSDKDLDFAPGSAFAYSNGGYYMLGRVIERLSGDSYQAFVEKNIVAPLGLRSTFYYDPLVIRPGRVTGYLDEGVEYINNPYEAFHGHVAYAAGGLEASVDDLARFDQALRDGKLVDPSLAGQMRVSRTAKLIHPNQQYGLGSWLRQWKGRRMEWHGGDIYGWSSTMVSLPDDGIFLALLTNNPHKSSRDLDVLAKKAAAVLIDEP